MKSNIKSPVTLGIAIDKYFKDHNDDYPDYNGMLLELDIIGDEELEELVGPQNPKAKAYQREFDRAKMMRKSWLEKKMTTEPKLATGCMNALKQPENGSYRDKAVSNADSTLTIKVEGVGGEGAFE